MSGRGGRVWCFMQIIHERYHNNNVFLNSSRRISTRGQFEYKLSVWNTYQTQIALPTTSISVIKPFRKFAMSTTVILPGYWKNCETIWQLISMLWANEISRDISSRFVSEISYIAAPPSFNSLRSSDVIWRHRSWLRLPEPMLTYQ